MKIIYATDIHGDFERVKSLLSETVANVYIIAGDLIDIPFYNMEASIRYHELQTYFHGLRRRMNAQDQVLEDFVDELLKTPNLSEELHGKATRYQHYTIRARRVMQQKYKVLKNIISTKRKSRVLCLPGNYDMNLKFTSLQENDLHLHLFPIDDLRICGYGGADVWTSGIPQRYIVKYQAGIGVHETDNEMYRFFEQAKPDIIVTHQPAYGINDRLAAHGPFGSLALRGYCDNHPVLLCLTGHIHDSWGVTARENTLYLNPSNFGEVTNPTGDVSEGGFFYQIELEQNQVTSVIFKKLCEDRIHDVADYYPEDGSWHEKIIDSERYQTLKNRENFDSKVAKYSHIPEIELFNEIKKFYRMFQTPETEERMGKLEEVAHILEDQLKGDIAMDVVGSVNIGLSLPGSDIDFILYLRCDSECTVGFEECHFFKSAQAMIKSILGNAYDFQIMDCVNLNKVNLQRFVAYRSICRPINYRVIAPIDDLLNQDMIFRKEVEGSIQTYFQIFSNTSQHIRSLKKYESRLNTIGIKLPEYIRRKIKQYLTSG
jgi:Icc-related predicted phosphoesterase